jgi:hypothetical protein
MTIVDNAGQGGPTLEGAIHRRVQAALVPARRASA